MYLLRHGASLVRREDGRSKLITLNAVFHLADMPTSA